MLASQSLNKENIDYSALEWYRVPMTTGEPHVAGPYVDYLCSDEYTITIAVPADVDGERIGVAGLDLLVSAVERDLTHRFAALGSEGHADERRRTCGGVDRPALGDGRLGARQRSRRPPARRLPHRRAGRDRRLTWGDAATRNSPTARRAAPYRRWRSDEEWARIANADRAHSWCVCWLSAYSLLRRSA